MKTRRIYKVLILILVVFFTSCRGSQQTKLISIWEQMTFREPTEKKTYWQFYAGDLLEIYQLDESKTPADTLSIKTYQYDIDGISFNIFPPDGEDDSNYGIATGDVRGEYWVDELSSDYFKATRIKHPDGSTEAAYLRIELVKR
ncbi:MAG: hypothetical protein AB7S69_05670 [Salinivirgaceae bacterium]